MVFSSVRPSEVQFLSSYYCLVSLNTTGGRTNEKILSSASTRQCETNIFVRPSIRRLYIAKRKKKQTKVYFVFHHNSTIPRFGDLSVRPSFFSMQKEKIIFWRRFDALTNTYSSVRPSFYQDERIRCKRNMTNIKIKFVRPFFTANKKKKINNLHEY